MTTKDPQDHQTHHTPITIKEVTTIVMNGKTKIHTQIGGMRFADLQDLLQQLNTQQTQPIKLIVTVEGGNVQNIQLDPEHPANPSQIVEVLVEDLDNNQPQLWQLPTTNNPTG